MSFFNKMINIITSEMSNDIEKYTTLRKHRPLHEA